MRRNLFLLKIFCSVSLSECCQLSWCSNFFLTSIFWRVPLFLTLHSDIVHFWHHASLTAVRSSGNQIIYIAVYRFTRNDSRVFFRIYSQSRITMSLPSNNQNVPFQGVYRVTFSARRRSGVSKEEFSRRFALHGHKAGPVVVRHNGISYVQV